MATLVGSPAGQGKGWCRCPEAAGMPPAGQPLPATGRDGQLWPGAGQGLAYPPRHSACGCDMPHLLPPASSQSHLPGLLEPAPIPSASVSPTAVKVVTTSLMKETSHLGDGGDAVGRCAGQGTVLARGLHPRKHVGLSLGSATFSLGTSVLNVEPPCPGVGGQSCSPAPRKLCERTPRGCGAGSWRLGSPPGRAVSLPPKAGGSVRPAEAGLGGGRRPQRFWKVLGPGGHGGSGPGRADAASCPEPRKEAWRAGCDYGEALCN